MNIYISATNFKFKHLFQNWAFIILSVTFTLPHKMALFSTQSCIHSVSWMIQYINALLRDSVINQMGVYEMKYCIPIKTTNISEIIPYLYYVIGL
jgi:hypothetical protein